jgi:hypothetical protein
MVEPIGYTNSPEDEIRQLLSPELVDAMDELLTSSFSSGIDANDFFQSAYEEVIDYYERDSVQFFDKDDVVNSIFDEQKFDFMRALYSFYAHVKQNTLDIEEHQTTQSCPVCMEPYGSTKETRSCVFSRCGHHICYDCLHQDFSARQKNSCVMCRQPMYINRTSVYLHELLQFAHDLYLDFHELYHWPPQSALGRYFIRWLWAYIGAMPFGYWPNTVYHRWTKYNPFCFIS